MPTDHYGITFYVAAWIELAWRAARERGITDATFVYHDSSPAANGGQARLPAEDASFDRRLASGGLPLHSWWSFDVPEVFPDPEQLYVWLTWGASAEEAP